MDYVTVLRAPKPVNKRLHLDNGKVVKLAGAPINEARAQTRHVPNALAMAALLAELAEDTRAVLVQGYQPDTIDGTPYTIMSEAHLKRRVPSYDGGWADHNGPCIARLKKNFIAGSWWQLDRDYADGIPAHLAALSSHDYVQAMNRIMPGFASAGRVQVPSTSSRVLHQGKPIESHSSHIWFQTQDASDHSFGDRLKLQAALNGLGFMKTTKAGASTLWALFDPTTFSWERLSYEGKPLVSQGLSLRPPMIEVADGHRVDTSLIPWPTDSEREQLAAQYRLQVSLDGRGCVSTVVEGDLTLDTPIETARGLMTPADFLKLDIQKLRCQATFRESTSWNGILFTDSAGVPCLFDNGTRIKYELSQTEKAGFVWAHNTELYLT